MHSCAVGDEEEGEEEGGGCDDGGVADGDGGVMMMVGWCVGREESIFGLTFSRIEKGKGDWEDDELMICIFFSPYDIWH